MSTGKAYRITSSMLGILEGGENERIAVTIPADAIVTIVEGHVASSRFVDCIWEGKTVTLFGIDLRLRGEPVAS